MSDPRSGPASPLRRWHRLVEHYTPDGALGRFLFASASVTAAVFSVWLAAVGLTSFGLLPTLAGFAGIGGVLAAALLTIVVLWPVYLSLIGNVESAAAYADPDPTFGAERDADDPIAVLQRRYAAGEIDEAEFERRLDDLLGVEELAAEDVTSPAGRSAGEDRLEDAAEPQ